MSETAAPSIDPTQAEMFDDAPRRVIIEKIGAFLDAAFGITAPADHQRIDGYARIAQNKSYFARGIAAHCKINQSAAVDALTHCDTFGQLYTAILEKGKK